MKLEHCKDLSSQSITVVEQLMKSGMSRENAMRLWCRSRTKEFLEQQKMFWVSGMRCYIELGYELTNDPLWMNTPFE